jgi:hypothetical protein
MSSSMTNDAVEQGFRLRRWLLPLGVIFTVCFVVAGVFSTHAAYSNIDGSFLYPKPTALFFGVFCSCMTLLGAWMTLSVIRFRLFVTETAITEVRIIGSTTIEIADASRVVWRRYPAFGSVIIRTTATKIKIEFGNFARKQRDELMAFCHCRLADEIQEGWSLFADRYAEPIAKHERQARTKLYLFLVLNFGALGAGCLYAWSTGSDPRNLQWGSMGTLVALWALWRLWVDRVRSRRKSSE